MQTLTMQGIAELAQVERPVVSIWRTRYATGDRPFPQPMSTNPLRFDAHEVADWLVATGRGKNPDAGAESALHSSVLQRIATDLERASVLLLVHQVTGAPVSGATPGEVEQQVEAHRLTPILKRSTLLSALADTDLCRAVDEVAEAAFSGARALDRLVGTLSASGGPWAAEALTADAVDLLGHVLAELHRAAPRMIVPVGPGGLLLVDALARQLQEPERPRIGARDDRLRDEADRVAWRRLAADGFSIEALAGDRQLSGSTRGRLQLFLWQGASRLREVRQEIEELVVELSDDDLLAVVAPARLLTERVGRHPRRALLAPSPEYAAPLRYVARLPKGLSRFGGRRRLALWVLGRPSSRWTVVGDHDDARLDRAARSAIAADVAAALGDAADVRAHAFRRSTVRETQHIVRQDELLVGTPQALPVPEGGERLARVWAARDRLLVEDPTADPVATLDLVATSGPPDPGTISLEQAAPRLARDLPGARIGAEHLGPPRAGWAHVLGPDELHTPDTIGTRGIDRLALERVAPRARLTEPGDVVYAAAGGPVALVDEHGGHVVLAPARIFRCRAEGHAGRRLVAPVVAADIAAQRGTDRRSWRLRTVMADRADDLELVTARTGEQRRRLLRQLQLLDELEREAVGGLADGTLAVLPVAPTSPLTPKAPR